MAGMTEQKDRAFLERLWTLQAEAGLSDSALARDLGVAHSSIWRLKCGNRHLGLQIVKAACARFPELRDVLFSDLPEITGTMPIVNEDIREKAS